MWAQVREWPGCFASGETVDELMQALVEAIAMYASSDDGEVERLGARITGLDLCPEAERFLEPPDVTPAPGPTASPRSRDAHRGLLIRWRRR